MNYVQVAIPFFIVALLAECLYGAVRKNQTYRLNDALNSLQLGVLSQLVGVLRLGFAAYVIAWTVGKFGINAWSTDQWWYWVISFVAYDFCYYWKHRFGHAWRIMWASHVAHHQSQDYNLSTALRQTSTDYIGFVFYLPLYLAGMPYEVIITVGSLNLVYQFWVHTEHVRTLGVIDFVLVTPANHRVHHAVNERYLDKNYGGVFILWDRLFGTFTMEDDEDTCEYGIRHSLDSWNPFWANFHVWWDTLKISLQAESWKDKFFVWFKSPGWLPEDCLVNEETRRSDLKYSPVTSVFSKAYTFVQFWVITGFALTLQASQSQLPRSFVLSALFLLLVSILVQGSWLEGRRRSVLFEWLRLVTLFCFSVSVSELWPGLTLVLKSNDLSLILSLYCMGSALFLVAWRGSNMIKKWISSRR